MISSTREPAGIVRWIRWRQERPHSPSVRFHTHGLSAGEMAEVPAYVMRPPMDNGAPQRRLSNYAADLDSRWNDDSIVVALNVTLCPSLLTSDRPRRVLDLRDLNFSAIQDQQEVQNPPEQLAR